MKTVLMSIHPRWCKEIFITKRKTIEVRKTVPKLETPFTVYVYQTKHKCEKSDSKLVCDALDELLGGGKVIGSFVCDCIAHIAYSMDGVADFIDCRSSCLSPTDFIKYGKGKPLYSWHITEPTLFDNPIELQGFLKGCDDMLDPRFGSWCGYCKHPCNLTRPPQSWCYVEV